MSVRAWVVALLAISPAPAAEVVRAVPTFECMSLEWTPAKAEDVECRVDYRTVGAKGWTAGHPLTFDPIEKQHRGSVVGLSPGTEYEFRLSLPDGRTATVTRGTWPDPLPVCAVETLPAGKLTKSVVIDRGGDATGFRLYRAHPDGTTIDVDNAHDFCMKIDADKVILQGVKCVGAKVHGVFIAGRKDVVVEGCDISKWGRPDPTNDPKKRPDLGEQLDSGIFSEGADAERLVIQGNRIHHPRYTTNDWSEWSPFFKSNHPQGPKAVVLKPQTKGNHVIRFNTIDSDVDHLFNDLLLESNPGWPGNGLNRDSDIYGNNLSHCTDDAIEIERGTRNVRVWENYFDGAGIKTLSVSPAWEGPYYVFRNVVNRPYIPKGKTVYNGRELEVGMFVVGGGRGKGGSPAEAKERGLGHFYHNTLLCPPGGGFERYFSANRQGQTAPETLFRSRNNLAVTRPLRKVANTPINDFFGDKVISDFDLFTGVLDRPAIGGKSNVTGEPKYRSTEAGVFQLADDSPGREAGTPIPNFTPKFTGKAPDIGAQQNGAAPMVFGTARWKPTPAEVRKADTSGVRFDVAKGRMTIRVDGETFGTYVWADAKTPRPFVENVFAHGGVRVTRNHPPKPAEDATDHDTIHPGIWLAVGNLNGQDFWRNKARVEHEKFLDDPAGGKTRGGFMVANRWLDSRGKLLAREVCRIDVFPRPNGRLLVWDSEFHPVDKELVFGEEKVGVFGVRLATPLIGEKGGVIRTSGGQTGEKDAFGREADWCDYSAEAKTGRTGVVVMCDPANAVRSRLLVREYGLVSANPFGGKALGGGQESRTVVPVGQSLRLRFAAFAYMGEVDPVSTYDGFIFIENFIMNVH